MFGQSLYRDMLPKTPIEGHRGYYPVCSSEEWEQLPALYKAMDWDTVKDPHDGNIPKAVKAVIFDVTYLEPYGVHAKVSVHPEDVQQILFCIHKDSQCHLYSVCGIELEGGTKLNAKWRQDTTTGAFGIYVNGSPVGRQGGFIGHIPDNIEKLDDGTFLWNPHGNHEKYASYALSNPFRNTQKEIVRENMIFAPTPAGDIVVTVKTDPNYPGVYVALKGENVNDGFESGSTDLAMIEFDSDKGVVQSVIYGDANEEEPTHLVKHKNYEKEASLEQKIGSAEGKKQKPKTAGYERDHAEPET